MQFKYLLFLFLLSFSFNKTHAIISVAKVVLKTVKVNKSNKRIQKVRKAPDGRTVGKHRNCGKSAKGAHDGRAVVKHRNHGNLAEGANVTKYEVGTFDDLTVRSVKGDKLDIHHAVQKHPAGQVINDYDPKTAPSMAVPQREHRRILTIKGTYSGKPRDLLAKDAKDLRNYTNAPNSNIRNLIRLNKEMFPDAFKKK